MKRFLFLSVLIGAAGSAWAQHDHASHSEQRHDMPVHPVHARMLIDPGHIRVRIVTDGAILANEILGSDLPVSGWPEDKKHQAKEWLDEQIALSFDGKPLSSDLVNASYRIDAWKKVADVGTVGWDGMFIFDLAFDLPTDAKSLTARVAFYEEDWEHLEAMLEEGVKPMFMKNFVTHLEIPGRRSQSLIIEIEKPDLTLTLSESMRTPLQRAFETISRGWSSPWPILFLLLSVLVLIADRPYKGFALAAAGMVASSLLTLTPILMLSTPWLGVGLMGFLVLVKPQGPGWNCGLAATGVLLGMGAGSGLFLLGSISMAAVTYAVAFLCFKAYRAHLLRESQQMGEKFIARNGRFAATAITAGSLAYGIRHLLS